MKTFLTLLALFSTVQAHAGLICATHPADNQKATYRNWLKLNLASNYYNADDGEKIMYSVLSEDGYGVNKYLEENVYGTVSPQPETASFGTCIGKQMKYIEIKPLQDEEKAYVCFNPYGGAKDQSLHLIRQLSGKKIEIIYFRCI